MLTIVLLGAGRVAKHLFYTFQEAEDVEVRQVYNRSEAALSAFQSLAKTTTKLRELEPADIYLIAVKDDAIEDLSRKMVHTHGLIAHTSGSVPLLKEHKKSGVFYPLQTFSKNRKVDFKKIPFCLEASDQKSLKLLENLAKKISDKVFAINSEQRRSLHLAAVFVSNFTNYLFALGEEICLENEVPFEILHSLMRETTQKAIVDSPENGQTGPAVRNDQETIKAHLEKLSNPDQKEIYTLLTEKIQAHYGKKL